MSERTDSQVDRIITEAIGACWHKYEVNSNCCLKCKTIHLVRADGSLDRTGNPSPTTDPTAYLEAMAWAKEQDWWEDFAQTLWYEANEQVASCMGCLASVYGIPFIILDPKLGSHALAQFLEGREG